MQTEPINFSAYIRHVRGGVEYRGVLSFDDKKFPYQLKLDVPIEKFVEAADANPEDLTSRIVELNISNIPVIAGPLDEMTCGILRAIIVQLVIGIGNDPTARNAREIDVKYIPTARKGNLLYADRISLHHSYSFNGQLPRIPQLEMLLDSYRKSEVLMRDSGQPKSVH